MYALLIGSLSTYAPYF